MDLLLPNQEAPRVDAAQSELVSIALTVAFVAVVTAAVYGKGQAGADPYVVRADDTTHTAIGIIYSPDLLARLVSQKSGYVPDTAIETAIQQRTPIVVMWSVPIPIDIGPALPPYTIVIVGAQGVLSADRTEPVWVGHDVTALAALD